LPPILDSPTPPFQARIKAGSAYNDIGLKVPLGKYGPTGPIIQYSRAVLLLLTPRNGYKNNYFYKTTQVDIPRGL
jgi:hypothetical protein